MYVFVLFLEDPNAWSIMGHLRYLQGNMPEAKDCYERTLAFVADAREMHAIYLRLASIYLQDGEVIIILAVYVLFVGQETQCPQIYTKLTPFEDNDSRKLP